ncbi:MAG TPA: GNAT family N-acetyltransferase [Acidimicrobiales bacterium]|nr:GNAT family N-acetyltransferase [Acidimicrobiales bacterium]
MDRHNSLPSEDEVVDRLHRHLRSWLGAWPPAAEVTVVGSARRAEPCWDGAIRPFAGVGTPEGTVLSVAPDHVDVLRAAGDGLEEALEALPASVGRPGGVVGRGVYRYAVAARDGDNRIGEWVPAEHPDVPAWLRPFGGKVLVVRDDGQYVAGLGIKRHDALGQELAVATEEPWRGRGLAKALVSRAASDILRRGGIPIYLHGRGNAASARVAEAAGFPDRGWSILGLPTAS